MIAYLSVRATYPPFQIKDRPHYENGLQLITIRSFVVSIFTDPKSGELLLSLTGGMKRSDCTGRIFFICAMTDDLTDVTYELRHLHLTQDTIRMMLAQGYQRVMFRVGDMFVIMDLTALTDGDYIITVDPVSGDTDISLNGLKLDNLPDYLHLASVIEAEVKV